MAVVAGIFVQAHLLVRHDDMALVTMYPKTEMFWMGKRALGIKGKFFVRMAPEAWEPGIFKRRYRR